MLRVLRGRRQKKFGAQFPDALDIIVRSLRAGHPVPIAITMVAREMPDPIGSEFGIVADEITYGADLETAMRNLYFRIGQDDLPLFVTAVAIQGSTGGNLGEILENLSGVIRQRFKMRRKIRALAAEGRASAMILSALPIVMFLVIQVDRAGLLRQRLARAPDQDAAGRRRRLDGGRQSHHVQDGQLQDLSDGHELSILLSVFGDSATMMLSVLVFLAAGTLAFAVMVGIRAREAVRRRAARVGIDDDASGNGRRSLRYSSVQRRATLVDYTTKHYAAGDSKDVKMLRRRLIQAGIYDPRARGLFLPGARGARRARACFGGVLRPADVRHRHQRCRSGCSSWSAASSAIWRRASISTAASRRKRLEHQAGFPDFMDLLVVCADAGLSMEAALDRVGRELGDSYPSLSANIHMANLEIRAGRTMTRSARASRRPARPRGGALLRHPDPAIGRARLEHHRCAARLQRRHAPQAAVARRGEGLQPAGQARAADDGLHLPGAVRGDPAAGHRAHGDWAHW